MKNRSPQVRKARVAAKLRRARVALVAGRGSWRKEAAAWVLWNHWRFANNGELYWPRRTVRFRRQPSDDIPF